MGTCQYQPSQVSTLVYLHNRFVLYHSKIRANLLMFFEAGPPHGNLRVTSCVVEQYTLLWHHLRWHYRLWTVGGACERSQPRASSEVHVFRSSGHLYCATSFCCDNFWDLLNSCATINHSAHMLDFCDGARLTVICRQPSRVTDDVVATISTISTSISFGGLLLPIFHGSTKSRPGCFFGHFCLFRCTVCTFWPFHHECCQ